MNIHVRLAEPFWRSVGLRDLDLTLPPASSVDDLLILLRERYPRLSLDFDQCPPHIFIGEEEANAQDVLEDGVRAHFVYPVAGG